MHRTRRFPRRQFLVGLGTCLTILLTSPALVPAASAGGKDPAVVIPARGTAEGKLLVFIPGTNLTANQSRRFLDTAADAGFSVVGVNYANKNSVASLCGKDSACFGKVRRDIVFGGSTSGKVSVTAEKSIVGRLTTALENSGWIEDFLDSNGIPEWPKIVASGHSQGAGHAAILGIDRPTVSRVSLIAGSNDLAKGRLPSWVVRSSNAPSKWFALGHEDDGSLGTQTKSWDTFGVGSREIETYSAGDAHLSLVVDSELGPTGTLVPDWKTLIGNTGA